MPGDPIGNLLPRRAPAGRELGPMRLILLPGRLISVILLSCS